MNKYLKVLGSTSLVGIGLATIGASQTAGENAIVFNYLTKKFSSKPSREGYHLKVPFITRVIIFETRTRFLEESASTSNRDLQTVNFTIRVLYKPDPTQLTYLAKNVGLNYSQTIMPPVVKEIAKGIIAQYTAQQLLSQREQVSNDIKAALKERLGYFSILIDEVSITQTSFSRDYEKAIEDKQIAQQTAERMKYIVQKAKQIKKSAIISAEAEVESIKLIGKAVKENPAYLTLQRIEAAREIAETLAKSRNKILLDSNMLLVNNLNKEQQIT